MTLGLIFFILLVLWAVVFLAIRNLYVLSEYSGIRYVDISSRGARYRIGWKLQPVFFPRRVNQEHVEIRIKELVGRYDSPQNSPSAITDFEKRTLGKISEDLGPHFWLVFDVLELPPPTVQPPRPPGIILGE
jgi:hypothetical protein